MNCVTNKTVTNDLLRLKIEMKILSLEIELKFLRLLPHAPVTGIGEFVGGRPMEYAL